MEIYSVSNIQGFLMDQFSRLAIYFKCFLRIIFVIINNVYCIPTYVVWMMIIYPLKKCNPSLYWKIEGYFFHWLLAMVTMWSWSAGYNIVELGDDIRACLEERTLVLANHQSTADVPLLMASFNAKKNVLPNLMWIMDRIFKFTNFGVVSVLHEDFFIVAGKRSRDESLQELVKHLYNSYIPRHRNWMVLFPEGGFLRKRRETSQRYALKNNLPVLNHVSLPRMGAMRVIMEHVGYPDEEVDCLMKQTTSTDHVNNINNKNQNNYKDYTSVMPEEGLKKRSREKMEEEEELDVFKCYQRNQPKLSWVLDITIAYPGGEPLDLPTIVTGARPPCDTLLFYRLYPCSQIPVNKEEMTTWLYDRFIEKEEMLDKFYKTGTFPTQEFSTAPTPPQVVAQDPLRFFILHLFFITSSYIHYHMITYFFSYIW